jgi:hypothetical protein
VTRRDAVWGPVLVVAAVACQSTGASRPTPSFTVVLERGPCLVGCPVYSVEITDQGAVRYQGTRHVTTAGSASDTIPPDSAASLLRQLEALDFFALQDRYAPGEPGCGGYIADLPVMVLSVRHGDRYKRVEYDPGCSAAPTGLRDLAERLDRATASTRWTGR